MEKHSADSKSGNILIKQVKIADPGSVYNNRIADIFISEGIITEIGEISKVPEQIIEGKNLIAMPGLFESWFPMSAS